MIFIFKENSLIFIKTVKQYFSGYFYVNILKAY